MTEPSSSVGARRAIVYCLVPRDLAARLHEPLRRHFRDDPRFEVVVERRSGERRRARDRRSSGEERPGERRLIRGQDGRRIGERRAPLLPVLDEISLPRRARPFADRLMFAERIEPTRQELEDLDTARLVHRFQSGDRDVFNTIYLRYFDRLYSYARGVVRDEVEAEDLTQRVFMAALESLPKYEHRGRPFPAWLFTIARNASMSYLRRSRRAEFLDPHELTRVQEAELDDNGASQADTAADVLRWISDRDLQMFIDRLPLPQRHVLVLRYMVDLSVRDIAAVLGVSEDVVRKHQSRALGFLRARLQAVGRSPEGPNRIGKRALLRPSAVLRGRRFALTSGPVR